MNVLRRLLPGGDQAARTIVAYVRSLEAEVAAQRKALDRLECVLQEAGGNDRAFWLYANRTARMDANVAFFPRNRREFHLARYRLAGRFARDRRVADIACGTGYGAHSLRTEGGAHTVIGLDIDAEAVRYAQSRYGSADVTFRVASGERTGLADGDLEMVVSFETIEHVPDDGALVAEFARILRPSGLLVVSTPNQWPCANHPFHVREYDRRAFESVLAPHFHVRELFNQNSGGTSATNRGQPAGLVPTTPENETLAECYVAVCEKR